MTVLRAVLTQWAVEGISHAVAAAVCAAATGLIGTTGLPGRATSTPPMSALVTAYGYRRQQEDHEDQPGVLVEHLVEADDVVIVGTL